MRELTLKSGDRVLLDDEDYERIAAYNWHLNVYGYPVRFEGSSREHTQRVVWLHREVLRAPLGFDVDHRHGLLLDCRKSELRLATSVQNSFNKPKRRGSSQYKGVFWFKRDGCWAAQIQINGRSTHLGYFDDENEAALAYNAAASAHIGEYAWLNSVSKM